MAALTDAQRQWLATLGVDLGTADAAAPFAPMAAPPKLDLNSLDMRDALMKGLQEQDERNRQQAEQTLQTMHKALADVQAFIATIPQDEMGKASYATIMKEVRRRFPEAAGLSQWVKQTSREVPGLRGKLPSPKALMEVVEAAVKARHADLGWSVSTGRDLVSVNSERLLAAYMAELPAGVSVDIRGGVVQLSLEGAALKVATPAGDVDAKAGQGGAALSLKHSDYAIEVHNDGWSTFDPQLRGEWKKIEAEASTLLTLRASLDEAEFQLAWQKLNDRVTATAKLSEQKISASVAWLKKDKNDKDAVKAGLEAEVDLKAMQGTLKAYFANPSVDAVLQVTAAADKVSARLELTALKSGSVVTARFEQALDETKAAIEVLLREGDTKIAAELKKKADDLSAKIRVVHATKDLQLAAELEKTLTDVRGKLEVAYTSGRTTLKGGGNLSSGGEAGGQVQIDIALRDGRTFVSEGDKLSFTANVSNKGYKFEVAFSMGEPVDTGSLQDLFSDADRQIKELYRLAGDQGVRSIDDAKVLNQKLQDVMAPVKDAANKAKTLRKKSEIAASFGFSVEGEWPAGGRASPPAALFGVKLMF
jgi:hypothetical protein